MTLITDKETIDELGGDAQIKKLNLTKFEQFKERVKNPLASRLAKIEYQSHLLNGLGIIAVCIILIFKGLWYIIFALIFGVGVSYSQGMTAYKKYKMICAYEPEKKIENFENDISFTRRRSNITTSIFPQAKIIASIIAVIVPLFILNIKMSRWALMFFYPLLILLFFFLIYFFIFYEVCYLFYKQRVKKK